MKERKKKKEEKRKEEKERKSKYAFVFASYFILYIYSEVEFSVPDGELILNFDREGQIVLQSGYTNLHLHQQNLRVPISHILAQMDIVNFFEVLFDGEKCYDL